MENNLIKVGISSCLLGNPLRYNGGHQLDRFITETLGRYFTFVPVCPEVECGLGVPRESMRLSGDPQNPRLITKYSGIDHTERMRAWALKRVQELENEELHGFIFKSKSPSSGMARIKVYGENGRMSTNGIGIFAREFMRHFPLLPVEDDGKLHDPALRENFIERLFVSKRWRELKRRNPSPSGLVAFHTSHKFLLLAHSESYYRALGQLTARAKDQEPAELFGRYEQLLMTALSLKTTRNTNTNVLHHLLGFFKQQLSHDEKEELLEIINNYQKGYLPLIVPITLVNHYVRKYQNPYLAEQYYLHPHPVELKLRNHA